VFVNEIVRRVSVELSYFDDDKTTPVVDKFVEYPIHEYVDQQSALNKQYDIDMLDAN
jgi:hypothetical protein